MGHRTGIRLKTPVVCRNIMRGAGILKKVVRVSLFAERAECRHDAGQFNQGINVQFCHDPVSVCFNSSVTYAQDERRFFRGVTLDENVQGLPLPVTE
jgi:hypothetical protein